MTDSLAGVLVLAMGCQSMPQRLHSALEFQSARSIRPRSP
jgi:hypothetical protein